MIIIQPEYIHLIDNITINRIPFVASQRSRTRRIFIMTVSSKITGNLYTQICYLIVHLITDTPHDH